MRSIDELKTKPVTTKMSPSQYEMIKKYADEEGMSVSLYMVTRSLQKDGLTPELLIKIQNIVSIASRIIQENEPVTMEYLRKGMREIWAFLS